MPLHMINCHENESKFDFYTHSAVTGNIPKHRLSKHPKAPSLVRELIPDELLLDGNAQQNLATFCQTDIDKENHILIDKRINKNRIDKEPDLLT